MKSKLIFLMLGILFLFNFASCDYETHKKDTTLYYSFTSNNATECNISSANTPYGTLLLDEETEKNSQNFNVTIDSEVFSSLGDYCFNIICSDGETIETGSFCREVTPTGKFNSVWFYIIFLIISLGLVIVGIKLQDVTITILGAIGLYFLGLYILFNGIVGVFDPIYTWAIGIIILGLAFYVSTRTVIELL